MFTNNRSRIGLILAAVTMAVLGLTVTAANAGVITYVRITNDADSGISTDNVYTHKLDFGTGTPGALVNGVQFDAYNAAANGTLNFSRAAATGLLSDHAGNANHNVSGGLADLLTDMYYNGNNEAGGATTWTLSGLTPGQTYQTRIYTRQWGADDNRLVTLVFDPDGPGPVSDSTGKISEDNATSMGFANGNDAYYINYQFTAVAGQNLVITATQDNYNYSWHLYGLSNQEFSPATALVPSPTDKETDVLCDAALSWSPGVYAATHNVYFGTSFDEVNAGSAEVLAGDGLDVPSFDPGRLEFGQMYYWRVDEVNAAPDNTVFQGDVWSFTTEPYSYPITSLTAQASSEQLTSPAVHTIDGAGLDAQDQHGTDLKTMWVTPGGLPAWIEYAFDRVYKLDKLWVWNANSELEGFMGFGAKDVVIEYSADGETWTQLENVPEFAQGTGKATYTANTVVDFGGAMAQYVKLTISDNWGATAMVSLAEVRFFYVPLQGFRPEPADGATGVNYEATLNWRPGREATSHEVYLGTDANAVAEGTATAATVTDHSYTPPAMDLGAQYYWRVDEVGDTGTYEGDLWSFTTQPYLVVDDFESYTDDIEAETTVWHAWIDGMTTKTSGSQVGYIDATNGTFGETTAVHGGRQSMPLFYDNTTFAASEAEFDLSQDWTANGIKSLSLYFRGDPGNSGSLYVKINNTKAPYDGEASDVKTTLWLPWNIDLSAVGGNLSNVTSLIIGIEGAGAKGVMYIDDIRLYPRVGELTTPVPPGSANLAGAWSFDEASGVVVADGSGNGNAGSTLGGPTRVAGKVGSGALKFDGIDDLVEVPDSPSLDIEDSITIATWANLTDLTLNAFFVAKSPSGTAPDNYPGNYEFRTEAATGRLQLGHQTAEGTQYVFYTSAGALIVGEWQHIAVTLTEGDAVTFYINGIPAGTAAQTQPFGILNDNAVRIGTRKDKYAFLKGMMDDVRVYERALSAEEVAGLAGRTAPMHRPF